MKLKQDEVPFFTDGDCMQLWKAAMSNDSSTVGALFRSFRENCTKFFSNNTRQNHSDIASAIESQIVATFRTVIEGHYRILHYLLEESPQHLRKQMITLINQPTTQATFFLPKNMSALQIAINQKHTNLVELLVTNGADLDWKDNDGRTPMDYAIQIVYGDPNKRKQQRIARPETHQIIQLLTRRRNNRNGRTFRRNNNIPPQVWMRMRTGDKTNANNIERIESGHEKSNGIHNDTDVVAALVDGIVQIADQNHKVMVNQETQTISDLNESMNIETII